MPRCDHRGPLQEHILVQAATGAGKTIIFCKLIETLLTDWPQIRIGILAHRRELIIQAQDKLLMVWPQAPIGVACASTGMAVDLDKPVVIGSVQTLMGRLEHTAPFDIVIVNECHRIPPINKKSQYQQWFCTMKQYNPKVRILGFTATPFRLGHGYIYGTVKRADHDTLFDSLNYRIGISEVQEQGCLCAYHAKEARNISRDLKKVKVAGGYNTADLAEVMSRSGHVGSAVRAMEKYAAERKRIVAFCVTIAHAEKVMQAFRQAGHTAACMHSKMDLSQRDMTLDLFEKGLVRAQMEGNTQAAESLDRMIRCHMKDLKTTKVAREGEAPKGPKTSPSEWAAALIEKVSEIAEKKPAKKAAVRKKPKKSSDNTAPAKKRTLKTQAVTEGPHE